MRRCRQFRVNADPMVGHGETVQDFFGHVTADAAVTLIYGTDFAMIHRAETVTVFARLAVFRIILISIVMGVVAGCAR